MAEYPNCSSLGNRRSFHPWWPEAVGDRGKTVTTCDLCRRQEQTCCAADMRHQCSPNVLLFTACCSQAVEDKPFFLHPCTLLLLCILFSGTVSYFAHLTHVGHGAGLEYWHATGRGKDSWFCRPYGASESLMQWEQGKVTKNLGRTGTSMPQRDMWVDAWCLPLLPSSALGSQLMQAMLTRND